MTKLAVDMPVFSLLIGFASLSAAMNSASHVPESVEQQQARLFQYNDLVFKLGYSPTPAPNNPDLDCRLRRVAFDFSLKIMPSRAPLSTVWEALVRAAAIQHVTRLVRLLQSHIY